MVLSVDEYLCVFRSLPNLVCIWDSESETICDVNDKLADFTGLSRDSILAASNKGNIKNTNQNRNHVYEVEFDPHCKSFLSNLFDKCDVSDKSVTWTSVKISNSKRIMVTGMLTSLEKQLESGLEGILSKLKIFQMFQKAPVGVNCSDTNGYIVWANEYLLSLLGYESHEFIEHHRSEFIPQYNQAEEIFNGLKVGRNIINQRVKLLCKDGSYRHVLIDSVPCYDDEGKFSHCATFIRDDYEQIIKEMTLHEQLEKTAAIAREKDRFIRIMFHEVKTPLHVLASTTQSLTAAAKAGTVSIADVSSLASEVDRCLGLISDLNFAIMFESDKAIIPHPITMNLRCELAEILQPLGVNYSAGDDCCTQKLRDINVRIAVDTSLPGAVLVDKSLFRVMYNIVSNSIKYCVPHGTVTVSANYSQRDRTISEDGLTDDSDKSNSSNVPEEKGNLTFTVTNTTAGPLDLIQINKLFQKYLHGGSSPKSNSGTSTTSPSASAFTSPRQSSSSDKLNSSQWSTKHALTDSLTSVEGLGLGLYVSYNIVQCLGGLLECSTTDTEATFKFTVPVALGRCKNQADNSAARPLCSTSINTGSWAHVASSHVGSRHVSGLRMKLSDAKSIDSTVGASQLAINNTPNKENQPDGTTNTTKKTPTSKLSQLRLNKPRILVVDDSPICRKVLVRALEANGYATDTACDGQDACDKMAPETCAYAAVLMDLRMPIMDGLTATRIIKDRQYTAHVPVIIVTAEIGEEVRVAASGARANGFIEKPAKLQELLETLARHVIV